MPPAADGSDIALENNNLAYIGGQKSKEVINYHKTQDSGYFKRGGRGCGLQGEQRRGFWAGNAPFLDQGDVPFVIIHHAIHLCFVFVYSIS